MKIKVHVNFVCDQMLNSPNNIDYVFEVERPYLSQNVMLVGGLFTVIEESVYDILKDEAKIYTTCYFPRNKATSPGAGYNVEEAQNYAFEMIQHLGTKYSIKGTYSARNSCASNVETDPEDLR